MHFLVQARQDFESYKEKATAHAASLRENAADEKAVLEAKIAEVWFLTNKDSMIASLSFVLPH